MDGQAGLNKTRSAIEPIKETNVTDEITGLEINANGVSELSTYVLDLESKIRNGGIDPSVESGAKCIATPSDMRGRLSAANLKIQVATKRTINAISNIEGMLGV